MSEKRKNFYVDLTEDGDLIVRQETEDYEDPVVSDKYRTKFLLCSARCARKKHFGTFKNNIFKCIYFRLPTTHPYDILEAWIRKREVR